MNLLSIYKLIKFQYLNRKFINFINILDFEEIGPECFNITKQPANLTEKGII